VSGVIAFEPGYFGFLGNQMFQYAAMRSLAEHHKTHAVWPNGKTPDLRRWFRLEAVDYSQAVYALPPLAKYTETGFAFDEFFFHLPDNLILSGYFQSEKYFAHISHIIRREFVSLPRPQPQEAVSIHVRRGDYLSFPDHHPPCSLQYYREAMEWFPQAEFLVFSDDPGWCLANLKAPNVRIVTGQDPVQDMQLMSACTKGHIIANSSFSWWGAWLDANPDKVVIAPKAWFGPSKLYCLNCHHQEHETPCTMLQIQPVSVCGCGKYSPAFDTKDLLPEGWARI
jgi:Glycosyl transferase family 11